MKFNTAIFYDIENLIGGYGRADFLSELSLKNIYEEIKRKDIGNIAIQRAYANWSDQRLSILRGDIIELGIEPIQMFGFGRWQQKNASDIQLAIDALDVAFNKTAIEIFVIVSGDGGFSSLAKKLHEYGKTVMGFSYKKTSNRVFAAICDDFIWLDEPKETFEPFLKIENIELTDPILIAYAKKYKPIDNYDVEKVFEVAKDLLRFFTEHNDSKSLMYNIGLNISTFSQGLNYRLSDNFNIYKCGFNKLVDFLRYFLKDTNFKLIHKPPSEYRIISKKTIISDFVDVEPLYNVCEIHTIENYKQILSKGSPIFRLPDISILYNIAQYVVDNKAAFQDIMLGEVIDIISSNCEFEQNDIKSSVLSMISAECFLRQPIGAKLSEQKLSFRLVSAEQTLELLKESIYHKIMQVIGEVNEDTISKII